jgi:uncharacterized membrane protein YesL
MRAKTHQNSIAIDMIDEMIKKSKKLQKEYREIPTYKTGFKEGNEIGVVLSAIKLIQKMNLKTSFIR